jgi:hypothetical protein
MNMAGNPYRPLPDDDTQFAPFAGRQKAFEHLYRSLTDPTGPQTTVIVGWHDSGKTALLTHFSAMFDETFIGVYLPLQRTPVTSEDHWLHSLIAAVSAALTARDYSLSRLGELEIPENDVRGWFAEIYLPEALNTIRRHRRLVLLLDDADMLVSAIQAGSLPTDTFRYLHDLPDPQAQVGFVLTLDAAHEGLVSAMSPLAQLDGVFRLNNLGAEDTAWFLRAPVNGVYGLDDEAIHAVQKATGGMPHLLQRFGFHLYRRWDAHPDRVTLTVEDVRAVNALVYGQSEDDFQGLWKAMERDERLVLTAIISLLYANPLAKVDAEAIEGWLIESDYPLDLTAINVAVRGLEYREITASPGGSLMLRSGLFQTWLLENARLQTPTMANRRLNWRRAALIVLGLVILIAIIAGLTRAPSNPSNPASEPTVTIAAQP